MLDGCPSFVAFRVRGSGFRVQGLGFRVQGLGFRVQGLGFRVQGLGFRNGSCCSAILTPNPEAWGFLPPLP